jgi:hypothetical protein
MPVYGFRDHFSKVVVLMKILVSVFPEDREQQEKVCRFGLRFVNKLRSRSSTA